MKGFRLLFLIISLFSFLANASRIFPGEVGSLLQLPSSKLKSFLQLRDDGVNVTKWALLIAGSFGYSNYRHQADVCHAYQLLKKNGLKDENIVVFMYDDIAYNPENPYPGIIINSPQGGDVYYGVPKDYTGSNVTVNNFLAVLKGDADSVVGGSGKVIASGPNDHVFVFYSDHGGFGVLGMPLPPYLYAIDIIKTLNEKHDAGGYGELVFYLEACESGSVFDGILPKNISVYATTASNPYESSWGTYCPGMDPSPPEEFTTCLGDLYSVSWMEDGDVHNLCKETLEEQYEIVKNRTSNGGLYTMGSHVLQYGDMQIDVEEAGSFMGTNPANENATWLQTSSAKLPIGLRRFYEGKAVGAIEQYDADILHLWHKMKKYSSGSSERNQVLSELKNVLEERVAIDESFAFIEKIFSSKLHSPIPLPLGREKKAWDCLKQMVRVYEVHCGSLTQYGMSHMKTLSKLCYHDVTIVQFSAVVAKTCEKYENRRLAFNGVFSS